MVRRKKDQPPMKYRGFYCSDDLWIDMQKYAEIADESDSEYIRKAIEMRNNIYIQQPKGNGLADDTESVQKILDGKLKSIIPIEKPNQEFKTFFKK